MTDQEHAELLAVLDEIKGKFLLNGCHSELYDTWASEQGYRFVEIEIDNKASSSKTK